MIGNRNSGSQTARRRMIRLIICENDRIRIGKVVIKRERSFSKCILKLVRSKAGRLTFNYKYATMYDA